MKNIALAILSVGMMWTAFYWAERMEPSADQRIITFIPFFLGIAAAVATIIV